MNKNINKSLKFILSGLCTSVILAGAIGGGKFSSLNAKALGHEHSGNHYLAKNPTLETTGNKEFYAKVTDGNPLVDEVVVNGSWSTKTNGDKVTYNTKEYTIGLDAVSSLALSLDRINDGATIIIAPGTYNETLTLTKPVTIKGPNANATGTVSGSSDALLTGTITIGSDNITFDGVDFAGDTDSIIVLSDKAYSNLSFNHIYSTANPVTLNKVTDYADTVTNISSSSNYKRKAVIFVQRTDSAKTIENFTVKNSAFMMNGAEGTVAVLLNNTKKFKRRLLWEKQLYYLQDKALKFPVWVKISMRTHPLQRKYMIN